VDTPEKAAAIVAAARYGAGARGYSSTTRAGAFGSVPMAEYIQTEDNRALVIAMIEEPDAVAGIDAIVATAGLDAVFIGRGDLTVAYGETKPGSDAVVAATQAICKAARNARVAISAMTSGPKDTLALANLGATAFIVASDQTFLRDAAKARLAEVRAAFLQAGDAQ